MPIQHNSLDKLQLLSLIRDGTIRLAGNRKLRIYGALTCSSGKRMKVENRVFFRDEAEAISLGYRPCKKCMHHLRKKQVSYKV